MKTFQIATCLVSVAFAAEVDVREDSWKTCSVDSDCLPDFFCLKTMWRDPEGQMSSNQGCVFQNQCQGTGTWKDPTDDNVYQFWCNEEQKAAGEAEDPLAWATSIP